MKNRLVFFVMLGALVAGFAATAEGQSLGDAARLEAERRAKLKEQGKVITTDDVKSDRPSPDPKAVSPAGAAAKPVADDKADATKADAAKQDAAAGKTAETGAKPAVSRQPRDEEHWRERAKVISDRLNRLRSNAAAVEGRITTLQSELQSASAAQAPAIAAEIESSTKDLARFRHELGLIEGEWTKFEERARAANVPQGWIR
jgi:hypothetical protein